MPKSLQIFAFIFSKQPMSVIFYHCNPTAVGLSMKSIWPSLVNGRRDRSSALTDMVMIVSVLPLALIVATGAELHRPLAVVYIGGFFFAILLRLFIVPVLYDTPARLKRQRA